MLLYVPLILGGVWVVRRFRAQLPVREFRRVLEAALGLLALYLLFFA